MLRTHLPHRIAGAEKLEAAPRPVRRAANDSAPALGQTEPFMFTRLFVVAGVLLGGLALATMITT